MKTTFPKILILLSLKTFIVYSDTSLIMFNVFRYVNVRTGEQTGISPLAKKQVKPNNNSIGDHLELFNRSFLHPMTVLIL